MAFTITETQTPQPKEVRARLTAALGSAEVYFHPESACHAKLVVILQEVITADSMISIDPLEQKDSTVITSYMNTGSKNGVFLMLVSPLFCSIVDWIAVNVRTEAWH